MIIRVATIGGTSPTDPIRCDLPTYTMLVNDPTLGRAFADVPDIDVPADVAAFVRAYPVTDLTAPLPTDPPASLARSWQEHLARRYDLGEARWHPTLK